MYAKGKFLGSSGPGLSAQLFLSSIFFTAQHNQHVCMTMCRTICTTTVPCLSCARPCFLLCLKVVRRTCKIPMLCT